MVKRIKKQELPMMVVTSKTKDYIKDTMEGARCSGDFIDALNEKVAQCIDEASARCQANNRATLKPADL